ILGLTDKNFKRGWDKSHVPASFPNKRCFKSSFFGNKPKNLKNIRNYFRTFLLISRSWTLLSQPLFNGSNHLDNSALINTVTILSNGSF
ncbi:hypothetical protein QUW13_10675, partial [Enterococcus hirae]|nr:hypothetical protein [Enterococcus hirae]